ncbi:serine/threonine-protein kinase [Nonomuraea roseoviolacea]|uniref:non-specific serine/threonine protein kinase n=1 Tax=Nonomuraea roseoviolacea subsp. carminata TaxID=160689 RepID=A0ABT1JV17_9ACTN|nr:serine/threonine-protein kinase [Nonomuraea roseoviolacea]MCP2345545.1 serine/threonine protein kinase [Nonomuraea roseoviolacea subsp. carminata]
MSEISVPGYEIRGVLGQGGFGVVYRAQQTSVGREVALKVDNRVLLSERDRRRFMREVTAAGALSGHPHVVPVYDAGLLPDGRPYMVLELCPGGSLKGRLLAPADARDVGVRIADALAAAHAQGVLHRDVKPANLLLNRYGRVALSDFGLATMPSGPGLDSSVPDSSVTRESLTPAYAPPEAFELAEPTPAADVYSLAATVYALMSGRPPRFPESGVPHLAVILALHRLPVPDLPGVPPALTAVLRRALASDPRERTPDAAALRDELAAVPLGPASPAHAPSAAPSAAPGPSFPAAPHLSGSRSSPAAPHPSGPALAAAPHLSNPSLPAAETDGRGPGRRRDPREGDTEAPARHGVSRLILTLVTVLAIASATGVGVLVYDRIAGDPPARSSVADPQDAGTSRPEKGPFGDLETYTEGCPAAAAAAGAACVKEAECWGGLVIIAGDTTARRLGCEETHSWETYAVAPIPDDSMSYDYRDLSRHPAVKRVCSSRVLLASRNTAAKGRRRVWRPEVMPPSAAQFTAGARFYRCVGGVEATEVRRAFFHR